MSANHRYPIRTRTDFHFSLDCRHPRQRRVTYGFDTETCNHKDRADQDVHTSVENTATLMKLQRRPAHTDFELCFGMLLSSRTAFTLVLMCAVIVAVVRSIPASPQAGQQQVPFIGCPSDGQAGYVKPPRGQPK